LLKIWRNESAPVDCSLVDQLVASISCDARVKPEEIQHQIELEAVRGAEGGPAEQIERWLNGLEGQMNPSARRPEAGTWARGVWDQARDLIGSRPTGDQDSTVRRSRLSKLLEDAIKRTADAWGNEFAEAVRCLETHPGHRIAAIELSLRKLAAWCADKATIADKKVEQLGVKSRQSRTDVQSALDACQAGSGSFSFFGGRSGRSMRHFLDQVRAFARIRLQEDMADCTARFYRALRQRLEERLRELSYCRTRLDQLICALESPLLNLPASSDTPVSISEEALQQTIHPTNTLQVVLPSGETHIERSAKRIVQSVKSQDIQRLEVALQKLVLEPRGGLVAVCQMNADMLRTLVAPMVEQTTAFLGDLLPVTDVTDVEIANAAVKKVELATRIEDYHRRSAPPVGTTDGDEQTFLLFPDSESGKGYAKLVKKVVPSSLNVAVNGSATDLMFCREHGTLRSDELLALLSNCQHAYYESLATPQGSPHARYDVTEWMPISE
jgi:hypothetical protein